MGDKKLELEVKRDHVFDLSDRCKTSPVDIFGNISGSWTGVFHVSVSFICRSESLSSGPVA